VWGNAHWSFGVPKQGGSRVATRRKSLTADKATGAKSMKPVVLMVGADKGGVGKTTVTRTVPCVLPELAGAC